ncbi:Site-specific recombinase XerD [Vibrio crassostreae]|uniref:tyrosine-type recombinase/integrase n=1 Tax=Vibrio crassostreae TaxID=246167 RepID=UPI001046D2A5|nr:tyrosine-type recombinase/integrase [Vibrio crassostreae]TCN81748.1 site-specific recombinase XerD [Vibrio crassostreae]CAK2437412.1 Site-specific recombinase XerD [Vibrio crassostreae]CAK2453781.1 Site-specific recombinase XerD [Vibrio crassostreae]CAK3701543.1 Site-specific recombinase XerD [Vibrio crassostreae]CAK3949819.1 Site-specific recombinase XerD [Vibrio crassostreae]
MYLLRLPNSVYYTRIATPLSLRNSGYPKEFKFSLLTRERKVAYLRNIEQVQLLHALFDKAKATAVSFAEFKSELADAINQLRQNYRSEPETTTSAPKLSGTTAAKAVSPRPSVGKGELAQFIESKQLENITQLTIKQLQQRCSDFLGYLSSQGEVRPSNSLAMAYRDELIQRKLSHKSLKDYLAANRQFFNWCVAKELIASNPFMVVKLPKNANAPTQRRRWKAMELKKLFSSRDYKEQGEQFDWITKLQMHQGCRPSEACQLRIKDIKLGITPCIHFSDDAENQHLKNAASNRVVPIHQKLLQSRFLDYVEQRKQQGAIQLFDLVPRGDDLDWSKVYRDVFGDVLDACHFKARQRPTAYSFRHTVVDELQKAGIEEHVVAQIVGHKHNTMTYGHYAKPLSPEELVDAVNSFQLSTSQ